MVRQYLPWRCCCPGAVSDPPRVPPIQTGQAGELVQKDWLSSEEARISLGELCSSHSPCLYSSHMGLLTEPTGPKLQAVGRTAEGRAFSPPTAAPLGWGGGYGSG